MTKSYTDGGHTSRVLHHLSFRARSGEITMITGPSGSGKTTLFRIMGGLSRSDSGTVTMHGNDCTQPRTPRLSQYRNQTIGFIFQDYRLLDHHNAIENVMLPLMIAGLSNRMQVERATQALRVVGLDAFKHRRVSHLSVARTQHRHGDP